MAIIAQLIKLQDYISRYEWDVYRYPTQFIRVKKQNWDKLREIWSNPIRPLFNVEEEIIEEPSPFSKIKRFLKKKGSVDELEYSSEHEKEHGELPETEEDLKHYFLDKIFHFQLKWATSTVNRISYVNQKYYTDPLLKYLLQRFPDTYLLMYTPVFRVKNAPMDGEILLISPVGIEILYFLEAEKQSVIMAGNERTWAIETKYDVQRILNPNIALKRTEKMVRQILQAEDVDFPVYKTIISRVNSIVYTTEPYQTKIYGKTDYPLWFNERRQLISTLKSQQLKAAEAILRHCYSTSVPRPDWEDDISIQTIGDLE